MDTQPEVELEGEAEPQVSKHLLIFFRLTTRLHREKNVFSKTSDFLDIGL